SGVRKRTCTVCGKVSETNPINKVSSIKLSKTSFTYNGKVQKPTVTVKDSKGTALKNGTDYTVTSSSGCKNIGKYCVEVTFKGNYSGSKKLYFSILPQGTSIESLSASSAGFTAKWKKKTNQITGYQLQYSTSNSFKSVKTITIKKNSDTSRSVSNLKGRTKYYVRVRTYKKVGNKNYYSSWSSAKTVATKPVTGVEILSSATIYVGGSKTLSAKTYPTKVTVKWKSSNTSVAKVSSNGKVTAIKKGKATITAYFAYGGKTYKANCAVTVKSRNPKIK
ncbi:MAG: Ig-like domain-containing protein, partial [Oscillospiraceae bacterium]|nr:Ig-like domain-containing protein [Oscillospiraceae bacterium]